MTDGPRNERQEFSGSRPDAGPGPGLEAGGAMEQRVQEIPGPQPCSDTQARWLAEFRAGHTERFQALVGPHLGAMQALARRVVGDRHWAEDLVQETLVRALRGLVAFRGEASLRTWLFRILIRLANEPGRWRRSERAPVVAAADIPDALGPTPDQPAIGRELDDRLAEALERLTARQRTALHLRAVEGMDYRAIAATLGCGESAARMLVLEARRKVMARIGGHLRP